MSQRELPIPEKRGVVIWERIVTALVVVFSAVAVVQLSLGAAIVAPCLWLLLVALFVWSGIQEDEGVRNWPKRKLGRLHGRRYVQHDPAKSADELRVGFTCLGREFVEQAIPIDRIVSIDWHSGQATSLAGLDMNDWTVWLYFEHGDPAKSLLRKEWSRYPDQDLIALSGAQSKDQAEAFALVAVEFVRQSGLELVSGDEPNTFVRTSAARNG